MQRSMMTFSQTPDRAGTSGTGVYGEKRDQECSHPRRWEADVVISRQTEAHWAQLIHQQSLGPPSPASLQTNSRPYSVKKYLLEEVKPFLMPSTGPGDRSESGAIAGGQVAVHGCPGSAACQVLCQGFYSGLSPQT